MTNAEWWATVKTPGQAKERPPRPSGRVWTMHRGPHEAALDLRLVPGLGAEIVLSIDHELSRARFYWRTQVLEMLDVIASTGFQSDHEGMAVGGEPAVKGWTMRIGSLLSVLLSVGTLAWSQGASLESRDAGRIRGEVAQPLPLTAAATIADGQGLQPALPSDAQIKQILADRIDNDHWSAGIVVGLISREGRRIVSYGRAANGDAPLNGDTVFEIGSVTKVFTSLVLADMALRREVTLDDPIEKFLPADVKAPTRNGKSIALRDLATHTSGLPRMPSNLVPRDWANPYADYSVSSLYTFLSSVTLAHDIGSTYEYSNIGYGLLGHLLALKTGMDYETLVTSRVLKPIGMHDTAITLSAAMKARLTAGHNPMLERVPSWDIVATLAGAGGFRSTAHDLLTFLAAVLNATDLATRNATELMLSTSRPTATPIMKVGLGWHVLLYEERTIVYHEGGTGGYRSLVAFDREAGTGVVILSNTNSEADLSDLGLHILDRRAALLSFRPTAPGDPTLLDRYTGVYQLGPGVELTILRIGWLLYAKPSGQFAVLLSAEGDREFSIRGRDARITFEVDSTGKTTALTRHEGGRSTRGTRIK